jgi:phage protein D/phage baseplate assembly protein gpV
LPEEKHKLNVQVKIGGTDASDAFMGGLRSLEVEQTLHLPSMFVIDLNDDDKFELMDSEEFKIGKAVEILMADPDAGEEARGNSIFKGEITSIEPWFGDNGVPRIVIRGYDKSHRLNRGKVTKSWIEVKDTDIATQLAEKAGLEAQVDNTPTIYKHVWQYNQSNWEFLLERANRIGYWLYAKENKLYFSKTPPSAGEKDLQWGKNLSHFNIRMSAAGRTDKVMVRGWDHDGQNALIGEVSNPDDTSLHGGVTKSGGDIAKAFGDSAENIQVDIPVFNQDEAKVMAHGIMNKSEQDFIQGEGVCVGTPDVQSGAIVKIEGLGKKWSGKYRVTRALHRIDMSGYYTTEFTVSSRYFTLGELIAPANHNGSKIYNPVLAKVTNVDDDEGKNRIKFKMPWLSEEFESGWARVVTLGAGQERGFYWLPEVEDEVMVVFEHGDVNRPLVVGGLWSSNIEAPSGGNKDWVKDGAVNRRGFVTRTGWKLEVDDTDGAQCLIISSPNEKTSLKLDQDNKLVLICSEDKVSIKSEGDVTVGSSNGKLNLEGSEISLNSTGNISIEGSGNVKVKATGQMNVEGTGPTTVKSAATLKAEGGAMTEIKGGMVKIN